jgi:hypothetical protein
MGLAEWTYRCPIRQFNFTELEGKDKWTAYKFTKDIYHNWMPTHFQRLYSVIDALPADMNFGLSQQSKLHFSDHAGLSQDLASHVLSALCKLPTLRSQKVWWEEGIKRAKKGRR